MSDIFKQLEMLRLQAEAGLRGQQQNMNDQLRRLQGQLNSQRQSTQSQTVRANQAPTVNVNAAKDLHDRLAEATSLLKEAKELVMRLNLISQSERDTQQTWIDRNDKFLKGNE